MEIGKVMKTVHDFFNEFLQPPFKVPSIQPNEEEDGWAVVVEIIEEREYMKAHAKDEMIGVYHVRVDQKMNVISYERIGLRARSALMD